MLRLGGDGIWHEVRLLGEFFAKLAEADEKIAAQVMAAGCRNCRGPLHQGNDGRNPRGAEIDVANRSFKADPWNTVTSEEETLATDVA